jgi:hypothetical protein
MGIVGLCSNANDRLKVSEVLWSYSYGAKGNWELERGEISFFELDGDSALIRDARFEEFVVVIFVNAGSSDKAALRMLIFLPTIAACPQSLPKTKMTALGDK